MSYVNNFVMLKKIARFRLFARTKRDIVAAGCTSGGFCNDIEGCAFSRGEPCSLDSQNKIAVHATPKETRLGSEPMTYGYNFQAHGNTFTGGLAD
jgi:hypothetical protein